MRPFRWGCLGGKESLFTFLLAFSFDGLVVVLPCSCFCGGGARADSKKSTARISHAVSPNSIYRFRIQ